MRTNNTLSRRSFIKGAAAASIPAIIPASAFGAGGRAAPSERVVLGCIGVGSRGMGILGSALKLADAQVVAVCDVKRDKREAAAAAVNEAYGTTGCAAYNNHEEIVARDDIDACIIASCDHWHVLHALAATRAGKDVYVEKPLGLSVEQDQALRAAVRKHKTIFQFGTQQRSDEKFRRACELVRNGRIGKLETIHVWAPPSVAGGPTEVMDPPKTLDYDRWLGPAPFTPYTKDRETNSWWWFISDYALGFIAGWGIHPLDIALWGADDLLRTPVEVEGVGTFPTEGVCDTAIDWDVVMSYESGVRLLYRAQPAPPIWQKRYGNVAEHGTAFEGTDGWVFVKRNVISAHPESLLREPIGEGAVRLYRSDHHLANFIECVKSRKDPISPIEAAVEGDIMCHLADVAIRLERRVRWNPRKERFVKDDEANTFLTRAMREPWTL